MALFVMLSHRDILSSLILSGCTFNGCTIEHGERYSLFGIFHSSISRRSGIILPAFITISPRLRLAWNKLNTSIYKTDAPTDRRVKNTACFSAVLTMHAFEYVPADMS